MFDVNSMIAANIVAILKKQNRKQIDLAGALQTNKQTISKMLNGSRMINAIELKRIAEFLGVKMEALNIADKLSNMILFHSRVRDNGMAMMKPWEA